MRRAVLIACLLAVGAPAGALAQTPEPGEAPPLVQEPPVAEPPRRDENGEERPDPPAESGQLPDTGADARVIAVLGAGLLLGGIGLRLRTTDERF